MPLCGGLQVKKSGKEQDDFLAEVDALRPIEGLHKIQAEMSRVQGVINSMKDIIKMIAVRESLTAKIAEFEAAAKNPDRLKGNSAKLMKEEKERKLFARKNDRICVELITKIEEWEKEMRMPFMYRGMHYRHVLQAEQASSARTGGTNLARTSSREAVGRAKAGTPRAEPASAKAAPATAPRPASALPRKEGSASRRLSGSGTASAADRKKQLEDWRASNEKKKEAAGKAESSVATPASATKAPTRRRLSVGDKGGDSK